MKTSQAPVWSPTALPEALALRAAHPDATVLAGGTDVMVYLEAGAIDPPGFLNLWGCSDLRGVAVTADGGLRLGALTTFAELRDHAAVPAALRDCARTIGAAQIQARATVGGNIVNASPAGDSLPLWLALGAELELASASGVRFVPAASFFLAYRRVDLRPDELLVAVHVPPWSVNGVPDALVYRKVGTRLAQAISKVVLGARIRLRDGVVEQARVALGSVAPTPVRLRSVEDALVGQPPDPEAAERVMYDIAPINDVRSTALYRVRVARNIVRTWLVDLREQTLGQG